MARRPTPRPVFTEPTHLPAGAGVHHTWGDADAGHVHDEVLLSSLDLHALIFTIPGGGGWRHSPENPVVFAADEVYHVLSGRLLLIDPEHGEVADVAAGASVAFGRDTWHHGRAFGTEPLRVLELMAPTPAAGASTAYALGRPYLSLDDARTADDARLGTLDLARPAGGAGRAFRVLGDADRVCRLEGDLLVGLLLSTPRLTAAIAELPAGGTSELRRYGGDCLLHALAGGVTVEVPDGTASGAWTLAPGDTFVLPRGRAMRLRGSGPGTARLLLGVAPAYLPGEAG